MAKEEKTAEISLEDALEIIRAECDRHTSCQKCPLRGKCATEPFSWD